MLLPLSLRFLLLCVLSTAAVEEEQPWTLEALVVYDDPSDTADPSQVSAAEENLDIADLETLATLELTLHDVNNGGNFLFLESRCSLVSRKRYIKTGEKKRKLNETASKMCASGNIRM